MTVDIKNLMDPLSHAYAAAGGPGRGLAVTDRVGSRSLGAVDSNDYSVHPGLIGRRIKVVADLDRLRVFCEGKVVADHERVLAWHQTITT